MKIQQLKEIIKHAIKLNEDTACLSLISKNEQVIVNEIAKYINKYNNDVIPCIEYKRIDLALLNKKKLIIGEECIEDIIEIKRAYNFDLNTINKVKRFMNNDILRDFNKNVNLELLKKNKCNQYEIIIINDVLDKIDEKYLNIIKYSKSINTHIENKHKYKSNILKNYLIENKFNFENIILESNDYSNFLKIRMNLNIFIIKNN